MWFGLIWVVMLLDYAKNFIVLYAASTYYFNSPNDQGEDGSADVMEGVKLAHFKHLGSICFGSLIIAIIKFIKYVFVYMAKKAVTVSGQEDTAWGKIAKAMICCAECILNYFEKIIDYINNAAFAYMAITGESFCWSAYNGFLLNIKWAGAFASAKFFAVALIFIGKAAVTCLNCMTAYGLILAMQPDATS